MKRNWLVSLGVLTIWTAFGQQNSKYWSPPNLYQAAETVPKATVPKEMVTEVSFGGNKVILGRTSLDQLAQKFGASTGRSGDAGDALEWICLYGDNDQGRYGFWLYSHEADGGSIGGFKLVQLDAGAQMDARCVRLAKAANDVRISPRKLHLGMDEASLRSVLGDPTETIGKVLLYDHQHEFTKRHTPYTSDNVVAVVLQGGMVRGIEANKTEAD